MPIDLCRFLSIHWTEVKDGEWERTLTSLTSYNRPHFSWWCLLHSSLRHSSALTLLWSLAQTLVNEIKRIAKILPADVYPLSLLVCSTINCMREDSSCLWSSSWGNRELSISSIGDSIETYLLTDSPAFVTAPVSNPIHQCSVVSLSIGVFELVVLVLEAPCSISLLILIEQIGKNFANVLAESARAKQEVSWDTTLAELERIEEVTLL